MKLDSPVQLESLALDAWTLQLVITMRAPLNRTLALMLLKFVKVAQVKMTAQARCLTPMQMVMASVMKMRFLGARIRVHATIM